MSDCVDKTVMLLVTANLADQKNRIEDESGDDDEKEDATEEEFETFAPVEDDPTDVERDSSRDEANAQRDEEVDRFLAADDAHREIVAGQVEGVRYQAGGFIGNCAMQDLVCRSGGYMKRLFLFLGVLAISLNSTSRAQSNARPQILVLGTYHMSNPGRDVHNMQADDILSPKRQQEIAN